MNKANSPALPLLVSLPFHCESIRDVPALADLLFSYLDDHAQLAAHMSKSSWMMLGSHMAVELDASQGRAIGSHIRLNGRVLGVPLFVEEIIVERQAPRRKAWQTTGRPMLLVIGHYRMGFEITPQAASSSRLRIFIDYGLPQAPPLRWLGRVLGSAYARWCTESMADDAVRYFA